MKGLLLFPDASENKLSGGHLARPLLAFFSFFSNDFQNIILFS